MPRYTCRKIRLFNSNKYNILNLVSCRKLRKQWRSGLCRPLLSVFRLSEAKAVYFTQVSQEKCSTLFFYNNSLSILPILFFSKQNSETKLSKSESFRALKFARFNHFLTLKLIGLSNIWKTL